MSKKDNKQVMKNSSTADQIDFLYFRGYENP
jgi:hypothetical protein